MDDRRDSLLDPLARFPVRVSFLFSIDPANFLTHVRPCNAESRGAAFYGKAALRGLKVSELATFTRSATKNSRSRGFFWELTGAKVSIRLGITTCGE